MNKVTLWIAFVVCLIGGSVIIVNGLSKPSIKGVSTTISPTPTTIPTPTPTIKPISHQAQSAPQAKQYGGWYWQPDLNRAQVWIGTDSSGKDIWTDHSPIPTPTPTANPAQPTQTNSRTTSKGNMIQEFKTQVKTFNTLETKSP